MNNISVFLVVKNEALNIERVLKSVEGFDDIVVILLFFFSFIVFTV